MGKNYIILRSRDAVGYGWQSVYYGQKDISIRLDDINEFIKELINNGELPPLYSNEKYLFLIKSDKKKQPSNIFGYQFEINDNGELAKVKKV